MYIPIRASQEKDDSNRTTIIKPVSGWSPLNLIELWRYRDLLFIFVQRDLVSIYKQTVLGPLWFLLQPLLTTLVFTLIFGKIALIPTDGVPPLLFYLLGTSVWNYFSGCVVKTSSTFIVNAHIFGKVYFPRLVVPLATVISNLVSFALQFILFLVFVLIFAANGQESLIVNPKMFLLPFLILEMAALGIGCGIIVSSLTTRYRDLIHLIGFGIQLWMFVTPVVYPASMLPANLKWLLFINPMASIIDLFRVAFHGVGKIDWNQQVSGFGITIVILILGLILFARTEKSFVDTV